MQTHSQPLARGMLDLVSALPGAREFASELLQRLRRAAIDAESVREHAPLAGFERA